MFMSVLTVARIAMLFVVPFTGVFGVFMPGCAFVVLGMFMTGRAFLIFVARVPAMLVPGLTFVMFGVLVPDSRLMMFVTRSTVVLGMSRFPTMLVG